MIKILPLILIFKTHSLSQQNPQQQTQSQPTPEQVYQQFTQNELNSRQMFELLYKSYIQVRDELTKQNAMNAQLIEQLNQFTKKKVDNPSTTKNIKKGKKD